MYKIIYLLIRFDICINLDNKFFFSRRQKSNTPHTPPPMVYQETVTIDSDNDDYTQHRDYWREQRVSSPVMIISGNDL